MIGLHTVPRLSKNVLHIGLDSQRHCTVEETVFGGAMEGYKSSSGFLC